MPKIINAYSDANNSIADSLKSIGQSIWGDEAKNEGLRQHAEKLRRENSNAEPYARAMRDNDMGSARYYGAMHGLTPEGIGVANRVTAAGRANGNYDDPMLGTSMLGAGEAMSSTPEGQRRSMANQRAMEQDRTNAESYSPIMGEDYSGNKTLAGVLNKRTGQYQPSAGGAQPQPQGFNQPRGAPGVGYTQPGQGGPMTIAEMPLAEGGSPFGVPPHLSGQELADHLAQNNPQLLARAMRIINAEEPPPRSFSKGGNQLLNLAAMLEPGYNQQTWAARYKANQNFAPGGGGKGAQQMRSLNQGTLHLGDLAEASQNLHNVNSVMGIDSPLTSVVNTAKNAWGAKSNNPAVHNFEMAKNAFANEFATAFRTQGGMSRADIEDWRNAINSSLSEDQLRAQVKQAMSLLDHVRAPLDEQRSQGFSPFHQPGPMMSPDANDTAERLQRWIGGGKYETGGQVQPAGPQPAAALPPGPTGHPPSFNDRFEAAQPGAPPQAPPAAAQPSARITVRTPQEAHRLAPGTHYFNPNGDEFVR